MSPQLRRVIKKKQGYLPSKSVTMSFLWFYQILFILVFLSCNTKIVSPNSGVLKGVVGEFKGNCMPSPGAKPCEPTPVQTTLYISAPAKSFDKTLLVDSIQSNQNGEFKIRLDEGQYSIFIKDKNKIVCNGFECDPKCICTPFYIKKDSTTTLSVNLNHASW